MRRLKAQSGSVEKRTQVIHTGNSERLGGSCRCKQCLHRTNSSLCSAIPSGKKNGTRMKTRVTPPLTCPGEEEEHCMRSVQNVVRLMNE